MDPQLTAGVVAAVTAFGSTVAATPVRYLIDRKMERHRARLSYEYEQRKELAALVRRYHGRLVEEADALHQRLLDIWLHDDKQWLRMDGDYSTADGRRPYFFTTVYRFASFTGLAGGFERGVLYLDDQLATPVDMDLMRFVKALRWCLTDTRLFEGLGYNFAVGRDHLFRDLHRSMCEAIAGSDANAQELHYSEFAELLRRNDVLLPVLRFFDGLAPLEDRLRWDRLVAFDLLLMAMINAAGYPMQRSTEADFERVAGELRHAEVGRNLVTWLPRLGLDRQRDCQHIVSVVARLPDRAAVQ